MALRGFRQLSRATKLCFTSAQSKSMSSIAGSGEALVETETTGNVFLIGINRPAKRNCVNPATAIELIKAFKEFERKEDLWVAVLYGKGGTFSAGFDLSVLGDTKPTDGAAQLRQPPAGLIDPQEFRGMGPTKMVFSKPVIAAIQGYAVAGGLELSLIADMRVVEQSAIMGVFCRRFGVPLIDGGTLRLPALIGLSRALDVILTGRPLDAQEALMMGLANRIVPDGQGVHEAIKLAQSLCQFPQKCMNADRRSAYNAAYDAQSYDDAFKYEYEKGLKIIHQESVKGAQRFVSGVGKHGSFNLNEKSKL